MLSVKTLIIKQIAYNKSGKNLSPQKKLLYLYYYENRKTTYT